MKVKSLFILTIILILGIFASGCSGSKSLPVVIPLEESVKEIIISKGDNYHYIETADIAHFERYAGIRLHPHCKSGQYPPFHLSLY